MHCDVLIVGQGLAGTWLSYWLELMQVSYLVVDDNLKSSSSAVASGVINPVTGRRMATTWKADEIIPFAVDAYSDISSYLNATNPHQYFYPITVCDFFSSPDRRLAFKERAEVNAEYLHWPENENAWLSQFNYQLGYGEIAPSYLAQTQQLIMAWRRFLETRGRLVSDRVEWQDIVFHKNKVEWKIIRAGQIVFAEGHYGANNPWHELLPFALNKGEALILDIPGMSCDYIFKKVNSLVPWKDGLFWTGSTYDRTYFDALPSQKFKIEMEQWLKAFLKLPYKIVDHVAGIRPGTVERRPFAGFHPRQKQLGILNGFGSKGVSIAPWLAKQLAENIAYNKSIDADVSIERFKRILSL